MKFILKWTGAWFVSSICAFVLASIFHSQFVLFELTKLDIVIPLWDWIGMTFSDLAGLALGYGSAVAGSLLLAFLTISALNKWAFKTSQWMFVLAGALAVAAMLMAMHPLLDVTLIAGARSVFGFASQCVAGAIGGFTFWHLTNRNNHY